MDDRDIRALLRGATRDKTLTGWYHYDFGGERYFVVCRPDYSIDTFPREAAVAYCTDLYESGTDFLYIAQ